MEKEFLTINEVAEFLAVSRMSVYHYFEIGLIYHKLGHSVRIGRKDLQDFIERRKKDASTPKKTRKRNR